MKTLKTKKPRKITKNQIGTSQPPGPATTQTHRAAGLTPQTRTVHPPTRRRTRKNTQRNNRQTYTHRKQTQNNRRTNENTTLTKLRISEKHDTSTTRA